MSGNHGIKQYVKSPTSSMKNSGFKDTEDCCQPQLVSTQGYNCGDFFAGARHDDKITRSSVVSSNQQSTLVVPLQKDNCGTSATPPNVAFITTLP